MKICDLALFSPETSSGVKTYIQSKIDYVSRRSDVEHVVIVPGRHSSTTVAGRSTIRVVRGVSSWYPGIRIALNPWKVATIVEQEQPDLIELNCQYALPWAAFLATRRRRTPIVGVFHTDVAACAKHMVRGAGTTVATLVERLVGMYQGLIYRHCTLTIILNPSLYGRVTDLGVDRICCLPCGVDIDRFSCDRRDPAWRAELGIGSDATVLLYVGRLSPEKEVDVVLEAHRQLHGRRYVLVIIGDGPDAKAIARYAREKADVRYAGHIESRDDLARAYASADIFLSPGRHETFGMATLEAISCGLPVVGIATGGTASVVMPSAGLLVGAGDPAAFAAAIRTVAAWPLDRLRHQNHAFAAAHYSWDRVLDGYFDAYRQLIQGGEPVSL